MKYFCAVVDHGSLTKAAKALHMAQPPLSKRLQELEKEVGVSLFLRSGRQIEPTAAGYFLYQRASEILREVETTTRDMAMIAKQERSLLRIGLTHLYQKHFTPLIMQIRKHSPNLEIGIFVSDSSHIELLLANKMVDMALIQRPQKDKGFDCVDLDPIKPIVVASRRVDLPEDKDSISLSSLDGIPLVLLKRSYGAGINEVLLDYFRRSCITPNIAMHISQPGTIVEMIESGLEAASILPASEVKIGELKNCKTYSVSSPPLLFFPSIVKMTTSTFSEEILSLIETGRLAASMKKAD